LPPSRPSAASATSSSRSWTQRRVFDRLYILDHRSADATAAILRELAEEGLPLALSRENYGIFYQAPTMTHLIKRAFDDHP
jgi:hypothetical protein